MLGRAEYLAAQRRAAEMMARAGIRFTCEEVDRIEVADFGLGNLLLEGAQILTFFSTDRASAKIIALFPGQILPEHWHPAAGADPGKEETIRVVDGLLAVYIPGGESPGVRVPAGKEDCYSARHELQLVPCGQLTIPPGTKHWLRAGDEGAVTYSFSTCARDLIDKFTDPRIARTTKVMD